MRNGLGALVRAVVLGVGLAGVLAAGGCSAQPANVAAEVRHEDGLYLVMSVRVPVLGETWKVVCNDAGHARLVEVVKDGVP